MPVETLRRHLTSLLKKQAPSGVCCAVLGLIILSLIHGCALDTAKVETIREDIDFLCANPKTEVARRVCDRLAPRAGVPLPLTPRQ